MLTCSGIQIRLAFRIHLLRMARELLGSVYTPTFLFATQIFHGLRLLLLYFPSNSIVTVKYGQTVSDTGVSTFVCYSEIWTFCFSTLRSVACSHLPSPESLLALGLSWIAPCFKFLRMICYCKQWITSPSVRAGHFLTMVSSCSTPGKSVQGVVLPRPGLAIHGPQVFYPSLWFPLSPPW